MNTNDTPTRRSVYVRLHPRADHIQIHRTVEMLTTEDSEVQVDYGIGGEVRGVEILGALDVEIDGRAASAAPETSDPATFIALQAQRIGDLSRLLRGMARRVRVVRHQTRVSALSWNSAVGAVLADNDRLRAALAAAATPAPPVDAAARLRAGLHAAIEVADREDAVTLASCLSDLLDDFEDRDTTVIAAIACALTEETPDHA